MVKNANGKWVTCVDFTDLNKACPKNSYHIPTIDRLVDGLSGNQVLSFIDAFSGYNQVLMNPPDQEKSTFITERGRNLTKGHAFWLEEFRCYLPKVSE